MATKSYDDNLDFKDMEHVNNGSFHVKRFKLQYSEGKFWIRVLNTYLNSNADEIPYWCKMHIYAEELVKLTKILTDNPNDVQLGLVRYESGVLGIVIYAV